VYSYEVIVELDFTYLLVLAMAVLPHHMSPSLLVLAIRARSQPPQITAWTNESLKYINLGDKYYRRVALERAPGHNKSQ